MSHNYKVGDKVEIAGYTRNHSLNSLPPNVMFMDVGDDDKLQGEVIWTPVTINYIGESGYLLVFWKNPFSDWSVESNNIAAFIRPISSVIKASIEMATSCINCNEGFMYPVEHNVKGGRLCFSCKSVYGWKYAS